MTEWKALTWELREALRDESPGAWVAISAQTAEVLARGPDATAVLAAASDPDPIVIRVPTQLPIDPVNTSGLTPPHPGIVNAWKNGRVVPFFGAGASLVGGLPPASVLMHELAQVASFPVSGLADLDLAKVSSFFESQLGRVDLQTLLRNKLAAQPPAMQTPGAMHRFLTTGVGRQARLVMTTNYDTLIEEALRAASPPVEFDVLVYPTDLTGEYQNAALWIEHGHEPEYVDSNEVKPTFDRTIIYKIHGSIGATAQWDSFVITEDDYMQFLSRMISQTAIPATVLEYLQPRRLLFLGYGLRDWNMRILLLHLNRALSGSVGGPAMAARSGGRPAQRRAPSWAIQRRPSPVECVLWKMRNIEIYDQDVEVFATAMAAVPP